MRFTYKVVDEKYNVQKGVLEASDKPAAKRILLENKWQVIELEEVSRILDFMNQTIETKLSYSVISSFCTELSMMIRTGANLIRGLETLQAQTKDKNLQRVISTMISEVSKGSSLSAAIKACGNALPSMLSSLVAVGEQSGNLEDVLSNMAKYYDRESFIRKKIGSAAVYPAILTGVLVVLIIFFINVILPEITVLLKDTGGELPLITRVLISSASFLTDYFFLLLASVVALLGVYLKVRSIPSIKLRKDDWKLRIPVLGKNIRNILTARFCRTMALFLKASIPIVTILDSMEKIMGNEVSRIAIVEAKDKIIKGQGLAEAFKEEKFFDEIVIQMMTMGEETGQLDELMAEIADYYDKQVEIGITKMIALVEPIFTILIGIFAGLMIIAVALPIMNLSNTIN